MFKGKPSNRGQVLIIFVFAIIGLIGITGLAIDGGIIYTDRRQAQNAADAAALAAAVESVTQQKGGASNCTDLTTPSTCGALVQTAALNRAAADGYGNDLVTNTVEVHIPPIDGTYSQSSVGYNPNDYIQVIINTTVNTFFARVLGIGQLHNRVEAVARATFSPTGSLYSGDSLVVLNPYDDGNCTGDMVIGGNGNVVLNGGGIFVNSNNSCAAYREGSNCPTVTLENGATISVYGTVNTTGCKTPPSPIGKATSQYLYPPDPGPLSPSLIPPAACNQTPLPSQPDPVQSGFTDYYPGHYTSQMPPTKNSVLEPGVYCFDSLIKLSNSYALEGTGVFLYFTPSTASKVIDITGGLIQLSAPTSGPYAGYLIYVDTNDWTSHPACDITGGTSDVFQGVIYAPACNVTINGGSSPTGYTAQIVAYTLQISGSTTLNFTYDPSKMPKVPEFDLIGLYH